MARPLLVLAAWLAVGCMLGGEAEPRAALVVLGLVALLLGLAAVSLRGRAARWALVGATVGLGAAGASAERATYEASALRRWVEARAEAAAPVRLFGRAAEDAADLGDAQRLVLDVDRLTSSGRTLALTGRVRLDVYGGAPRPDVLAGDSVTVWAGMRPVDGPWNPGGDDPRSRAAHDGLSAAGTVKSALLVERRPSPSLAARARSWARRQLRRFVPPGQEEALARAMVLGDRGGIDDHTAEAFRVSGTYHVLALSGAQVALVIGLLIAAARRLELSPLAQAVLGTAAAAAYAAFVGGDVPVLRAALMAAVLLIGRALDLRADLANLLGLAAIVLLVHRPSNVWDVGFQLSFGATLALLLLAPPLAEGWPRLPGRAEMVFCASLAAQAALFPLLALQFHRLAPAGLLLNMLAVPLASAVLLCGFGVLGCAAVLPALALAAGRLTWLVAHLLLRSSELGLVAPRLDPRVPAPSALAWAAWLAGVVLIARGRRGRGLGFLAASVLLVAFVPAARPVDGRLHLIVLDVGQGDALVVRSPAGRLFVVDAGGARAGAFDMGERVVGPYLWWLGVRRIEDVIVSHAHPDHAGGVPFLLKAFGVREGLEGPAPIRDRDYVRLDEAMTEAGVGRRSLAVGMHADWDGVAVRVLGPRPHGGPPRTVRNEDSLVLALDYGEVRLLLTGDVQGQAEDDVEPGRADVLKVPHHGSRSSSRPAFVSAVSPRLAIVSSGRRNPFGHPHPEVVQRYREAGALVLGTARDGAVTVSSDGHRVFVSTYRTGLEIRVR